MLDTASVQAGMWGWWYDLVCWTCRPCNIKVKICRPAESQTVLNHLTSTSLAPLASFHNSKPVKPAGSELVGVSNKLLQSLFKVHAIRPPWRNPWKESHLPHLEWRIQTKPGRTSSAAATPTDNIFCLRTGHCRLNSHLKRIGVKTSAQYPCGEADQTPEHCLQSCSLYHPDRQQIWPTRVSPKTKVWGSA